MVNYLALVVVAIWSQILGAVWYGPLFGMKWAGYQGWKKKDMEKMKTDPKMKAHMKKAYLGMFIGSLVMAGVLSMILGMTGMVGFGAGAKLGFFVWLGFFLPMTLGSYWWENKPLGLPILNAGYSLVNLLVAGGILGAWL